MSIGTHGHRYIWKIAIFHMYLCPCVSSICTYVQMYLCSICAYLPIYTYLRTRCVSSKKEKVCKEAAIGGVLKFGIKLLNKYLLVRYFTKIGLQRRCQNSAKRPLKKYVPQNAAIFDPPSPPCHPLALILLTPSLPCHQANSDKLFSIKGVIKNKEN